MVTIAHPHVHAVPAPTRHTPASRDREQKNVMLRRSRLMARECSPRWAEDLLNGHDRDWRGRLTGHGTAKVDCVRCSRAVPPQDAVDAAYQRWADSFHDAGLPLDGEPPEPDWICCDCRTIAPPDRTAKGSGEPTRGVVFERVDDSFGAEYVAAAWTSESPTAEAVTALAVAGGMIVENDLPPEDDASLAAAIAEFQRLAQTDPGAAMAKWVDQDGEQRLAAFRRSKYRANRPLVV